MKLDSPARPQLTIRIPPDDLPSIVTSDGSSYNPSPYYPGPIPSALENLLRPSPYVENDSNPNLANICSLAIDCSLITATIIGVVALGLQLLQNK